MLICPFQIILLPCLVTKSDFRTHVRCTRAHSGPLCPARAFLILRMYSVAPVRRTSLLVLGLEPSCLSQKVCSCPSRCPALRHFLPAGLAIWVSQDMRHRSILLREGRSLACQTGFKQNKQALLLLLLLLLLYFHKIPRSLELFFSPFSLSSFM